MRVCPPPSQRANRPSLSACKDTNRRSTHCQHAGDASRRATLCVRVRASVKAFTRMRARGCVQRHVPRKYTPACHWSPQAGGDAMRRPSYAALHHHLCVRVRVRARGCVFRGDIPKKYTPPACHWSPQAAGDAMRRPSYAAPHRLSAFDISLTCPSSAWAATLFDRQTRESE